MQALRPSLAAELKFVGVMRAGVPATIVILLADLRRKLSLCRDYLKYRIAIYNNTTIRCPQNIPDTHAALHVDYPL